MSAQISTVSKSDLQPLLELTQRVGDDPLLTQASTGNSSVKIDGVLWIKASGRWMSDALRDDIFIPLDLAGVLACFRRGADPAEWFSGASLETAMHAALPHRVVLHVHCVNTIAWAVRGDAQAHLEQRLDGIRWHWIPYVASGIPLAAALERAMEERPGTEVFVLGNHGLVIGGNDAASVDAMLTEVGRRLAIAPRQAHPADYAVLMDLSANSPWDLPDDNGVHALGTDPVARAILCGGLLYPCQAIFSDARATQLFCPVPCPDSTDCWQEYADRPFLIVEGRGVVLGRSMSPAEVAMISGLAQVVQRIGASTPLRYLTASEVAVFSSQSAHRYRELASAGGRGR